MFLGDENNEKQMARRQLLAVALMSGVLLIFMPYIMPPPVQQPTDEGAPPQQTEQRGPVSEAETTDQSAVADVDLPPIPDVVDPETDHLTIENEHLRLTLTRIGARAKQASILLGERHGDAVEDLVPELGETLSETEIPLPLGLTFSDEFIGDALDVRRWDLVTSNRDKAVFGITVPGRARITKTISLPPDTHVIHVNVGYENLEDEQRRLGRDETPAFALSWAPRVDSKDDTRLVQPALAWHVNGGRANEMLKSMKPESDGTPYTHTIVNPDWYGVRSAYYVMAMKPGYENAAAQAMGRPESYTISMRVPRFVVDAGAAVSHEFQIYLGPNTRADLIASGWETLPTVLRFFQWPNFMDAFAKFLLRCMNWIEQYEFLGYGSAIILLTLAVRLLMMPLTLKQVQAMKRMQAIQPEIEELRKKHEEDPQKLQEEMMKLWGETGTNPMGSCLPIFFQMPIFIALYRMLSSAYELRGAPFAYITDLSEADKLFKIPGIDAVPFIGDYFAYFNLLPLLGAAAMLISTRLMPQTQMSVNPQQKMIMTIMPIMLAVVFYNWAAGLNLYVLTSTVLGIAQTHIVRVFGKEESAEDLRKRRRTKRKRRQHWYTAAVAKKREMEKAQSKASADHGKGTESNGREGSGKRKGKRKNKKRSKKR